MHWKVWPGWTYKDTPERSLIGSTCVERLQLKVKPGDTCKEKHRRESDKWERCKKPSAANLPPFNIAWCTPERSRTRVTFVEKCSSKNGSTWCDMNGHTQERSLASVACVENVQPLLMPFTTCSDRYWKQSACAPVWLVWREPSAENHTLCATSDDTHQKAREG